MSNRRSFLYYSRLSVSEDLDTKTNFLQMESGRFDKDIFKKCRHCCHVFDIKKNFEQDEDTSNAGVKLLEKEVTINPSVYVLWKDMPNIEHLQIFNVLMLITFFKENQ